jgi:hypothetical protein
MIELQPDSDSRSTLAIRPPGLTGADLGSMLAMALGTFAMGIVAILLQNGGRWLVVEVGDVSVSTFVPVMAALAPLAVHWWDPQDGELLRRVPATALACFWGATIVLICAFSLSEVIGDRFLENVRLAPVAALLGVGLFVAPLSLLGDYRTNLRELARLRANEFEDISLVPFGSPLELAGAARSASREDERGVSAAEFEKLLESLDESPRVIKA